MIPVCESPVFIVGAARSGTTWIQTILAAHTAFYSSAETHFFDELLYQGEVCGGYQLHHPKNILSGKSISEKQLRRSFEKMENGFIKLSDQARAILLERAKEGILSPAEYLNAIMSFCSEEESDQNRTWVEKTPIHNSYLKEIFALFPKARVLCIVRDSIDVIISANSSMRTPLLVALKDYTRSYNNVLRFIETNPDKKDSLYFIYYEDVREDPDSLKKMFGFLGVDTPDISSLMADSKKKFQNIYSGTVLEKFQPRMKDKSPDSSEIKNPLDRDYLKYVVKRLLPDNELYNRYIRNENQEKSHALHMLKDIIYSWIYVARHRTIWWLKNLVPNN